MVNVHGAAPATPGRAFVASDRAYGLGPAGFNPCRLRTPRQAVVRCAPRGLRGQEGAATAAPSRRSCETTPGAAVAPAAAEAPGHEAGLSRRLPVAVTSAAFSRHCAKTHRAASMASTSPSSFSAPPRSMSGEQKTNKPGEVPAKVALKLPKPFSPLPSPRWGEASNEQIFQPSTRERAMAIKTFGIRKQISPRTSRDCPGSFVWFTRPDEIGGLTFWVADPADAKRFESAAAAKIYRDQNGIPGRIVGIQ